MKFEVNVRKKFAFMILGAILILAGVIYGYAYGGNVPDVMGHSLGEIDIVKSYSCGNGEYVKSIDLEDGTVVCETDDVGGVDGQFCIFKRTGGSCPSWAPVQEGMKLIGNFARLDDSRTGGGGFGLRLLLISIQ